jgi:hypothetical protein
VWNVSSWAPLPLPWEPLQKQAVLPLPMHRKPVITPFSDLLRGEGVRQPVCLFAIVL